MDELNELTSKTPSIRSEQKEMQSFISASGSSKAFEELDEEEEELEEKKPSQVAAPEVVPALIKVESDNLEQQRSKFDLPLEYHTAVVKEWEVHLSPVQVKPLSLSIVDQSQRRKSRFQRLQPRILLNRLKSKKSYAFMRNTSLKILESDVLTKLTIFYNIMSTPQMTEYLTMVSHNIFSWNSAYFLDRRALDNIIWLEVLTKEVPPRDIETVKFLFDLNELAEITKQFFRQLLEDQKISAELWRYLRDGAEFLDVWETLKRDHAASKVKLRESFNAYFALKLQKRDSMQHAARVAMAERIMDSDVTNPIEHRYHVGFYNTRCAQVRLKDSLYVDKLKEQIAEKEDEERLIAFCYQCSINMYTAEIEDLKEDVEEFTKFYDSEMEKADNKINYKTLMVEKLQEQHRFLLEQLERFESEIEYFREKDAERVLVEERKALEKLEWEARKAAKRAKKGRKSASPRKSKK